VARLAKPQYGWRSISTPDILIWKGKYYLYYQGFNEIPGLAVGDRAAVTVGEADSPYGPWKPLGRVVLDFGGPEDWDANAIHDPYPIIYNGKIHLYYKGSPQKGGRDGTIVRAQGVAIAEHPLGPFKKSPLNPVINSGHETCMFPWKGGVAAVLRISSCLPSTSISPVAIAGLTVASERARTRPVTCSTYSLRTRSARWKCSSVSGSNTTCTMPSRSRRSRKMTPP